MSAEEYKAQGNAAFSAKDYQKSVEFFTKAIEVSPTPNHVLYSNRSAAYSSLKDFENALKDGQKTVEINPTWAKGYSRVAAAEFGLGKYTEAEKSYSTALELDPSNKLAKEGLEAVRARSQEGSDFGLAAKFSDPNLVENLKKNPKTAEIMKDPTILDKVVKMKGNPQAFAQDVMSDPRLMTVMAAILGIDFDSDLPPAPEPEYTAPKATEPEPVKVEKVETPKEEPAKDKDGDVKVEDAETSEPKVDESAKKEADEVKAEANKLYKSKKFDEAIALYNKAFSIFEDVTYLNNRAAAEFEKGDYETTIKTCETAIEKGREVRADFKIIAKALARIGTTYLKLEKYDDAIRYFEKSLTEHRTPEVLTKLRSTQKLIKDLQAKSYIDPEKAEEARLQGKEFFTKSDWPNAVKSYTEMIKRAPEDVRGYSNRAAALAKLVSFPEAIKDCDLAIKIDPTFIRAYIRKANAEIAIKDFSKAIATLEEAKAKDTEHHQGANAREIDQLYSKAYSQRFQSDADETPEQTFERVSKDPEVAAILQDPVMNSILGQARDNPAALQEHMKNPDVAKKIQTLIAAGVIRTR